MNVLRVAWICEYPAGRFKHRPALSNVPESHPVPWVTLQASLVARVPGIELHIVTIGKTFTADDEFVEDGIHFHFCRLPRIPRSLLLYQIDRRRIHVCLDRIQPHVVHGFGTESSFGYAAATSRYPAVIRVQGILSAINAVVPASVLVRQPGAFVPALMERVTVRRCHDFVSPTQFGARFVRRLNRKALVHLIDTPVRPEAFTVERRPAPPDRPELLYVGSLVPAKGIETLLHALSRIAAAHPGVSLHLAGSGERGYVEGTLVPLVQRLGLGERVAFLGQLPADRLQPLWARASMLVLPTLMDTAPNAIAEAQVAGVPVVASCVGGIPEMVEHQRTGWLVAPGDATGLAEAIHALLAAPASAAALSQAALAPARQRHAPARPVAQLVQLYRDIASRAGVETAARALEHA